VKRGYKQTEVGVIPEDWELRVLPSTCWFQEGPGLRQWQFTASGMKVINVTNLENGVLNLGRTDRHIAMSEFRRMYQHFAIDAGDIVMASSGNSYGKTAIVREEDLPLMMNTSVVRFKPCEAGDYHFVWAFLNSRIFRDQIDLIITGGAQPNFGPYHLRNVLTPWPPLPEQRAIAAALSDADALISALDKLVAKKRDLKQAAMQQLLTGKQRLPGFHGEWEVKKLGGITDVDPENLGSDTSPDYSFKYISLEDVDAGALRGYTEQVFRTAPSRARRKLRRGDVLVSSVRPNLKSHLLIRDEISDTICSTGFSVLRCKPGLADPEFVFSHLFAGDIGQQIESLLTGSNYPAINSGDVKALTIACPSLEEQRAIAAILSDMDAEIGALERKRDKTRLLKQGMMQELLTGRIRLPIPAGEEAAPTP